MIIVSLQLKINNFLGIMHKLENNITLMFIQRNDKELFRKCREIWNTITELIGINDPDEFVETTLGDYEDEFIMVDVHKSTSFVEDNYRGKLVIVLHSVIDNYLEE